MPAVVLRELSTEQRRAIAYVRANPGVTTRTASIALQRTRLGLLSTFRALEGRGLLRCDWPNRPDTESFSWWITKEALDA